MLFPLNMIIIVANKEVKRMKQKEGHRKITDEFSITATSYGLRTSLEIEQELFSISLLLKSLFYTSSTLVYLISALNCFRELECSNEDDPKYYSGYSHSVTTYLLRTLAKFGIIKIISCERDGVYDLKNYYRVLGNKPKDTFIKMYDIVFIKCRDLTLEDLPVVRKILKTLNVNERELNFEEIDGKLNISVKRLCLLKNALKGIPLKRLIYQSEYLKEEFASKGIPSKHKK